MSRGLDAALSPELPMTTGTITTSSLLSICSEFLHRRRLSARFPLEPVKDVVDACQAAVIGHDDEFREDRFQSRQA